MLTKFAAAATLFASAAAVPSLEHRALFQHSGADLLRQVPQIQSYLSQAALGNAITTDADGTKHLWFHATDAPVPSLPRCGQVDAAPYMPKALFEPQNALALAAYAEATVKLYINPNWGASALKLGKCEGIGFGRCNAAVQGISWFGRSKAGAGSLMGLTCATKCKCNFQGYYSGSENLPSCRNQPDDPRAGEWCSLCSPATACPGCTAGTVVVTLCYKGSAPPPPSPPALPNIVALAVATPDLSTLVAAVKAAGLVDTLSGAGPFTVFAPTNAAFAAIQSVVDQLLLPEYKPQLVKLLTYHVLASKVLAAAITNGESVATVEGEQVCFEVNHRTGAVGVFPCGSTARAARVTTADVLASNGVVHVIDEVLVPPGFLPLPTAAATYVCLDNQCVISTSGGVSKDDCSKICAGN